MLNAMNMSAAAIRNLSMMQITAALGLHSICNQTSCSFKSDRERVIVYVYDKNCVGVAG